MAFENCVIVGSTYMSGQVSMRDSLWLGSVGYPWSASVFENVVITGASGGCTYKNCTIGGNVKYGEDAPRSLVNSILPSIEVTEGAVTIENCNVHGKKPFVDLARPGAGCFTGNPQFVNPKMLDYRLLPTSPCIGKASDGGDVGVRYTPEMMELCRIALELRAKGIVKF